MRCTDCGAPLSYDEIGLTKKLVRRDAQNCFCLPCLAKKFDVPESRLREKTEEYRAAGCLLFVQPEGLKGSREESR